jgi:hypothetical protein
MRRSLASGGRRRRGRLCRGCLEAAYSAWRWCLKTPVTAIACPQYGGGLAEVEEVHILLNTEPVVGFRLHDEAVQWLKGWALALRDEAVKRKAVEKARRVKYCQVL